MSDNQMTVKRVVGCLDFGTGYVRIDAAGVSDEAALDIAADVVAWLRSMHTKHRLENGSRVAEIPSGNAARA